MTHYPRRNAAIGSTDEARNAGPNTASTAETASTNSATPSVQYGTGPSGKIFCKIATRAT